MTPYTKCNKQQIYNNFLIKYTMQSENTTLIVKHALNGKWFQINYDKTNLKKYHGSSFPVTS